MGIGMVISNEHLYTFTCKNAFASIIIVLFNCWLNMYDSSKWRQFMIPQPRITLRCSASKCINHAWLNQSRIADAINVCRLFYFLNWTEVKSCVYSNCRDGCLSKEEFEVLCRGLFRNEFDEPYLIDENTLTKMFNVFDRNQVSHVVSTF